MKETIKFLVFFAFAVCSLGYHAVPKRIGVSRSVSVNVINIDDINIDNKPAIEKWDTGIRWSSVKKKLATVLMSVSLLLPSLAPMGARADDELAKYAAEGNAVAVDGRCFMKKCALETSSCANDPSCLKGLSCLARCKGGSMCSTGCFAKYGSPQLDNLLYCSVEKNDCVKVPGKGENFGWTPDTIETLPSKPLTNYDLKEMQGTWYKVMGLDTRYDCFDCQRNSFDLKGPGTLNMEALFRIPRPTNPGYNQLKVRAHIARSRELYLCVVLPILPNAE